MNKFMEGVLGAIYFWFVVSVTIGAIWFVIKLIGGSY